MIDKWFHTVNTHSARDPKLMSAHPSPPERVCQAKNDPEKDFINA
jgi:hypothetical protein